MAEGKPVYDTRTRIALIAIGVLLVSTGHYLTPPSLFLWHNIFQRLYYLPIVFAALSFGWLGGLATAAAATLCYIPHIMITWPNNLDYTINQYAEIVVFFLVGIITGILADRERKQRSQLQQTAEELGQVYRKLQASFEQLKRADRLSAIGELAASLAHEIRNPLASIEGAVDILEKSSGAEENRHEFLHIIKKESRRLNRLLTNLLDFGRLRPPRVRLVEVHKVVQSVVSLAAHTGQQSRIRLETDIPDGLPMIEVDTEQLQQVILNLTLNAIQAMPGGGKIVLSARQQGAEVAIRIVDQGNGIGEQDVEKIFDPFYTTKRAGTGLGLSVAHQIVTQHGGVIRVRRNPDRGMTFTVLLPLSRRSGPDKAD